MNILFDQGVPRPLRGYLGGSKVDTAYEKGWSNLENGDLLTRAEQAGYNLLVTTDQNLRYQQNLADRSIAILVLTSTSWPRIKLKVDKIQQVVDAFEIGSYQEIIV